METVRLLEYEGKAIFQRYGIPVPRSELSMTAEEAAASAEEVGFPAVVKAQVLSGGRGKAGGIATVQTRTEARREAERVLKLRVSGELTRALLVEESVPHSDELYLSITLDRGRREFVALASRTGGVEVSSLPREAMAEVPVPLSGLSELCASSLATKVGLEGRTRAEFVSLVLDLEKLSREEECELAEINPVAVRDDGGVVALDSKVVLDDNAIFRHPEFSRIPPEDPLEGEAAANGFAFVRLEGGVAVVGNGAGLVLSTLDLVSDAGVKAACFLDLGGGAQRERVEAALRLVRRLPTAKAVLVNIFGGITRTTDVAEGLRDVLAEAPMAPVFARISGAEEEDARTILAGAGVPVFRNAQEAVRAVAAWVSR